MGRLRTSIQIFKKTSFKELNHMFQHLVDILPLTDHMPIMFALNPIYPHCIETEFN